MGGQDTREITLFVNPVAIQVGRLTEVVEAEDAGRVLEALEELPTDQASQAASLIRRAQRVSADRHTSNAVARIDALTGAALLAAINTLQRKRLMSIPLMALQTALREQRR